MNCTECFMRDGDPSRPALFVINGQSVCQKHAHVVIRERGKAQLEYTWAADGDDSEPYLQPISD